MDAGLFCNILLFIRNKIHHLSNPDAVTD